MCGIMALAFLVALRGLSRGVQQDTEDTQADRDAQVPGGEPGTDLYQAR